MPDTQKVATPDDHAVYWYDQDGDVVAALARYVADGLDQGDRVVVVATAPHRAALDDALRERDVDAPRAHMTGRYVALDAAETLDTFMVDGLPDRARFMARVGGIVDAARRDGSRVRAFGEMVALLWAADNVAGALALESLWNDLVQSQRFSLLCAYPTAGLGAAPLSDVGRVCASHSVVLPPVSYQSSQVTPNDPVGGQRSEVFVPVPEAVGAVRRFVASVLDLWGENGMVSDAALLSSELATNALRHANSPFRVIVGRSAGVVRIAIEDSGQGRAERHAAAQHDMNGRGVALVEALSRRWGCDALPDGKIVWAELSQYHG